jgi:hypothetical protein
VNVCCISSVQYIQFKTPILCEGFAMYEYCFIQVYGILGPICTKIVVTLNPKGFLTKKNWASFRASTVISTLSFLYLPCYIDCNKTLVRIGW